MKIVHISDIHWRVISRHDEYIKAFELFFKQMNEVKPDLIVNSGDLVHSKTLTSPELFDKLTWFFNHCCAVAPMINILGNHDGALSNKERQDTITPVINAINNPNCYLYKKSGIYYHQIDGLNVGFSVFSLFDKELWETMKPDLNADVNIALFHGTVANSKTDTNWKMEHGEEYNNRHITLDFFKKYDFAMLGDIHKQQFLDYRRDKNHELKPYIGYPGSAIQQNHGEEIKKGYYIWDIRSKKDWDLNWKKLDNLAPFVSLDWKGNAIKTLKAYEQLHKTYAYMPGTRYRILSNTNIPLVQSQRLIEKLSKYNPAETIFKTEMSTNLESFQAHDIEISKKSLTEDPQTIVNLYKKYIESNSETFILDKKQIDLAEEVIKSYVHNFKSKNKEMSQVKNVTWSIKYLEFDNLFGYGKDNKVNFENLKSLVGILGPNRSGKSSILGALMFVLFNTTDRGPVKNGLIINKNKKKARGSVRVSVGHDEYIIERKTEKVLNKTNIKKNDNKSVTSVNLWKIRKQEDGTEVKVSANGTTRDETDKFIRKIIGTPDDFLLTAFASQENLNMFISNKATKRKEILNRFLELDVFDRMYYYAKEDYSTANAQSKVMNVGDLSSIIEQIKNEIEKIQKNIDTTSSKLENLYDKKDNLIYWINSHQKEINSIDQSSTRNIEKHIKNLEDQISNEENFLFQYKNENKNLKKEIKIIERKLQKINVETLRKNIDEMDNLKDSIVTFKNSLKIEEEKYTTQEASVNKLKLVPCGNKFPNCRFIKDGHEAKKTIAEQKRAVKALEKGIKSTQKLFDKFAKKNLKEMLKEYETLKNDLKLKNTKQQNAEFAIESVEKNIPSLKKELRSSKSKLKNLQKFTGNKFIEEFDKKNELLEKTKKEISLLEEEKNNLFISLGAKQDSLSSKEKEKEQNKDVIKKIKVFDSIQNAFSKNGIPAMILDSQLPLINKEISKVLNNIANFEIELETDTTANIMDIYVIDKKGKRVVELCSGMEKTMCSLALRVALGNLSALSRPNILVLDESFGALDEENLQIGIEMLSLLRNYFRNIFIITHLNPIKEVTDQIIEITNNEQESKVQI